MSKLPRIGSALTALALASVMAGCAGPMQRQFKAADQSKSTVGLAMRAQIALAGGNFPAAIELGEKAVEIHPQDGAMRGLLGNVYFGSGRFASAEAAYRDALAISSNQPGVILKLALVQIAQGKNQEALSFLEAGKSILDPADAGLAMALAGQPQQAIALLEPAARTVGADARVRQNLALAYGLSGDWMSARTIAAQDLPADQVDTRVRGWMALAQPTRASDQVAALVGVTPAASDPGQPVRLALRDNGQRFAQSVKPQVRAAQQALQSNNRAVAMASLAQAPADAVPPIPPMEMAVEVSPVAPEAPVSALAAAYQPPVAEAVVAASSVADAAPAEEQAPLLAAIAPSKPKAKPAFMRKASKGGNANVVVQLGAYSSAASVEGAWDKIAGKYGAVRAYQPTSARFDGPKGTVYRLSVKGFASRQEATSLCSSLRDNGKTCFVRQINGDAPVQFAAR